MKRTFNPSLSPNQAIARIRAIIVRHLPDALPEVTTFSETDVRAEVRRAWSSSVTIDVRLKLDTKASREATPEGVDEINFGARVYRVEALIGTSGTSRGLAESIVLADTLRAACSAVAEVEMMNGESIGVAATKPGAEFLGKLVEQVRVTDQRYASNIGRRSRVVETMVDERGQVHVQTEDGVWCPVALVSICATPRLADDWCCPSCGATSEGAEVAPSGLVRCRLGHESH